MTDATKALDATDEEEIFTEARDRLKVALDAESKNRSRAKIDLRFREGDQWDHDVITTVSEESPELVINLTDALCQRVENNIKQQRPRGKCHPVGDGADIEIADLINGIGRHIEVRSEASVAYDQAARSAITCGLGYFRVFPEFASPRSFEKEIRISPIRNVFSVYMDPGAIMPTGADSGWTVISVKMRRNEYARRYPRAKNVEFNDVGADRLNRDWDNKNEIRLAEYFRIIERPAKLLLIVNQQTGAKRTAFERDEDAELEKGEKVIADRPSSRKQVEWFRLNGLTIIERQDVPGTWIPVFRVEGNATDVDGEMWRRGMVRSMSDSQRMVNYGEVAKIKRLGLAPKAPWVAAEGQLDGHPEWHDANLKAYSVLTYKPVTVQTAQGEVPLPPPQRQQPPQVEAGFTEFVQGMRTNLLAVAGMPNEPGADMQGQVVSGVAQKRRQLLSDQSHYHYYDNLTLAIAQCWRVMLEWIPHYYSEERMQRIIGEDSTPKLVTINQQVVDQKNPAIIRVKNDLSVGRYDVVMDTGPGFETRREEGAENLLALLKAPAVAELIAKVGMDLVFRSIDHPYMQELADRIAALTPKGLEEVMESLPERARSIVRALAAQVQNLQQQLQKTQADLKFGITKAHLAAATKAHDTEVRAATAKDDRELQAGVDVFIESMKHGHETAMADRDAEQLINRGEANGNGSAGQQGPGQVT